MNTDFKGSISVAGIWLDFRTNQNSFILRTGPLAIPVLTEIYYFISMEQEYKLLIKPPNVYPEQREIYHYKYKLSQGKLSLLLCYSQNNNIIIIIIKVC